MKIVLNVGITYRHLALGNFKFGEVYDVDAAVGAELLKIREGDVPRFVRAEDYVPPRHSETKLGDMKQVDFSSDTVEVVEEPKKVAKPAKPVGPMNTNVRPPTKAADA